MGAGFWVQEPWFQIQTGLLPVHLDHASLFNHSEGHFLPISKMEAVLACSWDCCEV